MRETNPPPKGAEPPATATLGDGTEIDLPPIAREICRRHFEGHPEELERYGDNGRLWCEHDNRWILAWAVRDDAGHADLESQISWLARVLESRGFPLAWLASNLQLAAEELATAGPAATGAAHRLREEGGRVRATPTFLETAD